MLPLRIYVCLTSSHYRSEEWILHHEFGQESDHVLLSGFKLPAHPGLPDTPLPLGLWMQRSAGQALRFKLRVAICGCKEQQIMMKASGWSSVLPGLVEEPAFQFVILASPYETLRDLRRCICETFKKMYPSEHLGDFGYLKDASGFDLDEDFAAGEVLEPNDLVVVRPITTSPGIMTPGSNVGTPVETAQMVEPMIVCPAPKARKLDPEELLAPKEIVSESDSESEESESESESESEEEEAAADIAVANSMSSSEEDSEEESETESEDESEEESEDEPVVPVAASMPATAPHVSTVDAQIAAALKYTEEESGTDSELEVRVSSSESEESSEESEIEVVAKPAVSESESAEEDDSETESESSSEDDEETQIISPAQPAKPILPTCVEYSRASESEESESESESESEGDSSEGESGSEASSSGEEESESNAASSSSSEDESDSMDELTLPPAVTADVKQVLKGVPKYTSLTSLSDCLSQAVSGRATPLNPANKQPVIAPAPTKGRVRLPRRKATSTSGYDASLFA